MKEKGFDETKYAYIDRIVQRIDRPMFEWAPGEDGETVERICVFVLLPRYLLRTRRELGDAIRQNRDAIDCMVQGKIETELLAQKLDVPFCSLSLSKCVLRRDYILEYSYAAKQIMVNL